MFKWLKTSASEPLAVSMAGIKLGDRLLVIGCSDPKLIVVLAAKVGLTGRACAVDDSDARSAEAAAIAEREGVLIEAGNSLGSLPYPDDSFDVVVVRERSGSAIDEPRPLHEARRVLRPGGRCVAIAAAPRGGVGALLGGGHAGALSAATLTLAFSTAGFFAVRTLAERDGLLFVEGVKRNA